MNFSTVSYLALIAIFGATPAPAAAQASPPDLDIVTDEEAVVVTASRTPRPLSQVGESVTVVDEEEIETRQSNAAVDFLRTVPGVTFVRNGGTGTATSVSIRGAETDQTVVLIDGVKLNDPSSPGGGFNFGNLLTGNISRIEVVRGSQSVIWGSQAIGGVINLMTRAPTNKLQVNARAEAGSMDTYQAVANVSGRAGRLAGSFGAGYFKTNGFSAFSEALGGTERDGYENVGANGKLLIHVTSAVSLDLRGFYTRGETEIDGFPAPFFAFADTREMSRTEDFVGYAGINANFLDGRLRNRLAFTFTGTDRSNVNPVGSPKVTFDGQGRNARFEYQATYTPDDRIEAVVGADTETSRFKTSSFGAAADEAEARIDSLYGQLSASPVAGLRLTAGVRHDDHETFGGKTTLAANGVFTPNSGATTIRASYGEGFKAPSLFQLFSPFGNTALKPETSKSYDIGVSQRLIGGRFELGATLFRRNTDNQIDFVSCFLNPIPICSGRPSGTYDNIRRTRARGFELTAGINPADNMSVRAQYSYIDAKNRDTGRILPRRPDRSVSALVDYRWASGLETGATLVHVGASFDNASNTRPLDDFTLVDVRAAYPLNDRVEIYGRLENAFDVRYGTVFRYGTAGRAGYVGARLRM